MFDNFGQTRTTDNLTKPFADEKRRRGKRLLRSKNQGRNGVDLVWIYSRSGLTSGSGQEILGLVGADCIFGGGCSLGTGRGGGMRAQSISVG